MQPQPNDTTTATALQPGREMDADIAWRFFDGPNSNPHWFAGKFAGTMYTGPRFSDNLDAAMLIVEHKRRDGWVFSLQALPPDPANADNMLWECVFQRGESDGGFQEGHGATAPEAIARAALAEIER